MKQRILLFITIFFYFVLLFFIGKIVFLLVHSALGGGLSVKDVFDVLYHGSPLDLSMSGYLTVIPALALILSIWIAPKAMTYIYNGYFGVVFLLIGVIAVVDIIVYPYWGFHFDSTVFLYLQKPKETFASASVLDFIRGILGIAIYLFVVYSGYVYIIRKQASNLRAPKSAVKTCLVLILLAGALFLPIRGGVTVSTMNVGQVYYSDNMFLNHAAINPQFNLM
ncbi:MAG: LTA synthase family protein, partial [Prevotella sp.]|nr:LTA synthase family protein [Prevotella sp.]